MTASCRFPEAAHTACHYDRSAFRTSGASLVPRVLSSWREAAICGTVFGMSTTSNLYRGFRFPAEIINQAVWLYHCFSLSLREVELILAARGIVVSYETIRERTVKLMPNGQRWRGRSRQIGLSYYTRAAPVVSRQVAKACSRAARYSLADRR
jgi:hypothetical protein